MYTNLPYIYTGIVYSINEPDSRSYPIVKYTCLVKMPDGREIAIPNVRQASLFGGIGNYFRSVLKPTSSDSQSSEAITSQSQNKVDANVGDRVLIAFIGGNINNPIIVGYDQHPNQSVEPSQSSGSDKENMIFQYNGIRAKVDEKGDFSLIHKGAPVIKYAPGLPGIPGALANSSSLKAKIAAEKLTSGLTNEAIAGNESLGIEPASVDEITLLEMTSGGVFRVRDAEGQMIEMDRTKGRIYISNNDLKSLEDAGSGPLSGGNLLSLNATDAEYLLFDKNKQLVLLNARSIAQIYSFDKRKDVTDGDHSHRIGGNDSWLIGGDRDIKVAGNFDSKVAGTMTTLALKGEVQFGAFKLMESLGKIVDALILNAPNFVATAVGPGVLNPQVVQVATELKILIETGKA